MPTLQEEAQEAIRSIFPDKLAEQLKGVNLQEMERQTGISRQYISKLKSGKSLPSATILLALSWYLEVSPNDLIDPAPIGEKLEALLAEY